MQDPFDRWFSALEARYFQNLTFQEVRRAVQALSSLYVERRDQIGRSGAFDGVGKRAAFAYFYGPLHFLLVQEIVRALGAGKTRAGSILDLGCGTGVAGAAWAIEMDEAPRVTGIDRNPWAAQEAKWTYEALGLNGHARISDLARLRIPSNTAVIAAFTMNEIPETDRDRFRAQFLKAREHGSSILIIEPIARRLSPWWEEWASEWHAVGGREDEWRFRVALPERLALMDKAAGLDHGELTGRSLWLSIAK